MSRFPRSLAGASIAVLAGAAIAPTAVTAATAPPPPAAHSSGLLDGVLDGLLGDLLRNLLGPSQQTQLTNLLGILQGGATPTRDTLAPLTSILGQLGAARGLPLETQQLVTQLTALLNSGAGGAPLDAGLLAPVATLLRELGATQGLPAPVAQLLNQLADILAGSGTAGLPIGGGLNLAPELITGLQRTLDGLLRGTGQPTGELLAPLVPLLREVANTAGLPTALRDLINQLIDTILGTSGALDSLVTAQLSAVLDLIGNTPGVSTETRTLIERTTTILQNGTGTGGGTGGGAGGSGGAGGTGGSGTTGTGTGTGPNGGTVTPVRRVATAKDRAVITKVTLNRARTVASVRIACPKSAPATCSTTVRATVAGKRGAAGKRVGIAPNKSKVLRLKTTKAARRVLNRRGARVSVSVTTAFGAQRFTASKALSVKKRATR